MQVVTSIEASVAASTANLQTLSRQQWVTALMAASNEDFDARPNRDDHIQEIDNDWKAGGAGLVVEQILANEASLHLKKYQTSYVDNLAEQRFVEVYITNKFGVIIAATARTSDYLQADEQWYQDAISSNIPWIGGVEFDQSSKTLSVDIVVPIFRDDGQYIGCIKGVYSVKSIFRTLSQLLLRSPYKTTDTYLVSETGRSFFSSLNDEHGGLADDPSIETFGADLSQLPAVAKALVTGNGNATFVSDRGENILAAFAQTPRVYLKNFPRWYLIVEYELDEVLAPLYRTMTYWGAASVGIACLLFLAMARISHLFVSRPIARLAGAAMKIGEGDFDVEVSSYAVDDEIGTLSRNFATMTEKLRDYRLAQSRHNRELQLHSAALQQANAELAETNKLVEAASRAKTEFVANMSHEIRTPISVIISYIEMLLVRAPNKELEGYAKIINRNARHLLQVVSQVLDLAKIEAGKFELELTSYDVKKIVDDVDTMMRDRIERKGLAFESVVQGNIPVAVMTDPTRLREILINLVENALKFTDRGCVKLTTSITPEDGAPGSLLFEVSDTGPGISAEGIKSLFVPFTQLDSSAARRAGGCGLGLTISRRLAAALGGELSVRSAVGQGSCFSVRLPIRFEPQKIAGNDIQEQSDACFLQRLKEKMVTSDAARFLVAEDEPDIKWLMGYWLTEAGADVVCVEDGAKAIEAVKDAIATGRPFHTILMDMQMPGTDGYTAARKVRELGFNGRLIAVTAHAMKGDAERCIASGCDEYFAKPLPRLAVIDLVRQLSASA